MKPFAPKPHTNRPSTGRLTTSVDDRRVPLRGRITRQIAACSIARLLVLGAERSHYPVLLEISSPGGLIRDSLNVISTMKGIHSPVATFSRGEVVGMAVLIAAYGLQGYRTATPDARFSFRGAGFENGEDSGSLHQMLAELLAPQTGRPMAQVLQWIKEEKQFTAEQARLNGIIDLVGTEALLPKPIKKV
jgi:ATP-dependent protease ClpP protease subunit